MLVCSIRPVAQQTGIPMGNWWLSSMDRTVFNLKLEENSFSQAAGDSAEICGNWQLDGDPLCQHLWRSQSQAESQSD